MKVIINGATGMEGEDVLFEYLQNKDISEVHLIASRKYAIEQSELRELIIPTFWIFRRF